METKQILRNPIKKFVRQWLKYNVHMTNITWNRWAFMKTHRNYIFIQILIYFFVYNVIQTSCFFFLEKKKVADLYEQRRPSVLIETPANV